MLHHHKIVANTEESAIHPGSTKLLPAAVRTPLVARPADLRAKLKFPATARAMTATVATA